MYFYSHHFQPQKHIPDSPCPPPWSQRPTTQGTTLMKFPNDMLQAVATKPRNDSVPEVDRSSCYPGTLIQLLESKQLGVSNWNLKIWILMAACLGEKASPSHSHSAMYQVIWRFYSKWFAVIFANDLLGNWLQHLFFRYVDTQTIHVRSRYLSTFRGQFYAHVHMQVHW